MNSTKFHKVIQLLGKPYFCNGKTVLYRGDSLELLNKLTKPVVDLTVTSPPYNIGKEYEKVLPIKRYVQWSKRWMRLVFNDTKPQGSFWLNVGYTRIKGVGKAVPLPYLLWDKNDFYFQQELIWHYGAGVAMRKYLSSRNEKVLWYVKDSKNYTFNLDSIRDPHVKYPNQKKHGKLRCNPKGKNPTDVWYIPKVTSGKNRSSKERTQHPAQTPIELFKRLILVSSNPNDLVLDPFVGSGTTCVAAQRLHRYSIGIDKSSRYLDMAIKRLRTEKMDTKADY